MKRAKVVLHVGSHKTGTTGIQFALSQNRDHLRAVGVWYPKTEDFFPLNRKHGAVHNHLAFARAVADFPARNPKKLARFVSALHAQSAQYDRVILSSEAMYRMAALAPLTPDEAPETGKPGRSSDRPAAPVNRIASGPTPAEVEDRVRYVDRLGAVLCGLDAEVLLYLRRVDRFAASLYAEAVVRTNTKMSFHEFLDNKTLRFDYRQQIDLFGAYFPVKVRSFEAAAQAGLLDTFCRHAGIPGQLPPTPQRPRPSVPNAAVLWLLREKRAREMDNPERRRRWHFALRPENAGLFGAGGETGFWPDAAERDAFIERYQASVPEITFPEVESGVAPRVTWSDAQHRDTERQFRAWQAGNAAMLEERERNKIPPHVL